MGYLLYALAALIEFGSAYLRYRFGVWVGGPVVGIILGFGPYLWSLAGLIGLTSGVVPSYFYSGARRASRREREMVTPQLDALISKGVRGPRAWYVVDQPYTGAWVTGRVLFLTHDAVRSPFLRPIIAHELGHLNSSDGRLSLALYCLVFPGAIFFYQFLYEWTKSVAATPGCLVVLGAFFLFAPLWIAIALLFGGWSVLILLHPLRLYWRQREYMADKYAARLGEARTLADYYDNGVVAFDMATPWMFLTARKHPYVELMHDRLVHYSEAKDEAELRAVPASTRLDWAALGLSSTVFGALGLLVALCGLTPMLLLQAGDQARAARQQAVAGVNERVDAAVTSVGNAIAGAVADQMSRAFFGESSGNSGAVTGGSESTAAPAALPAGAPLNVTRVDGRGVSCDSLYAVQTNPVTVYDDPAPGRRVLAEVKPGSYLMLDCVESGAPGWIAARAGGAGSSGRDQGWVEEAAVNGNLGEVPPVGVAPEPVDLRGFVCDSITYQVNSEYDGITLHSVPNIHRKFGIEELAEGSYLTIACDKPFPDWVYLKLVDGSLEGWLNWQMASSILRPVQAEARTSPAPAAATSPALTPIPAGAGLDCNGNYVVNLPEADASLPLLERPDADAATVEVVLTGSTVSVDCRAEPQAGWISVVTGLGGYGWIPETASQYLTPVGPDTGAAPNEGSQP
jgi:Zn-dependent protease with chaperone function